jgi:hypothetical protein
VLTGDGGVATRRHTRGNERRRLELIVRAEEGAKKLRREGMRCSEGRGARERAGRGSNGGVNIFNAIEDGARFRGGLRGGNDGGVSNASSGIRG